MYGFSIARGTPEGSRVRIAEGDRVRVGTEMDDLDQDGRALRGRAITRGALGRVYRQGQREPESMVSTPTSSRRRDGRGYWTSSSSIERLGEPETPGVVEDEEESRLRKKWVGQNRKMRKRVRRWVRRARNMPLPMKRVRVDDLRDWMGEF